MNEGKHPSPTNGWTWHGREQSLSHRKSTPFSLSSENPYASSLPRSSLPPESISQPGSHHPTPSFPPLAQPRNLHRSQPSLGSVHGVNPSATTSAHERSRSLKPPSRTGEYHNQPLETYWKKDSYADLMEKQVQMMDHMFYLSRKVDTLCGDVYDLRQQLGPQHAGNISMRYVASIPSMKFTS